MTGTGNSLRGYIVVSLVWLAVAAGVWFLARRPVPQPIEILPATTVTPATTAPLASSFPYSSPAPSPTATPAPLRVDVVGAVVAPGVYRLPPNSIVADAIAAAGGPVPDADLERLNKATSLQDGMQIYVPHTAQTAIPTALAPARPVVSPATVAAPAASGAPATVKGSSLGQSVDINRATAEELDVLPGIGPALAGRIIAARPFASVDDLLRVPGIGPATLAKLKPYATVQ